MTPTPPLGARLRPIFPLSLRGSAQHAATLKEAWQATATRVSRQLGIVLPEAVWEESSECAVYSRGVRLVRIQLDHHSVDELTEIVVQKAHGCLSLSDTSAILQDLDQKSPVYGQEMERLKIPPSIVHAVLRMMLKEQVFVGDIETILSVVIEHWQPESRPEVLLEHVRERLGDWLCERFADTQQQLFAISLTAKTEGQLKSRLKDSSGGLVLEIDDEQTRRFLEKLHETLLALDQDCVLLCDPALRRALWRLTERVFPQLGVLSWNEVTPDYDTQVLASIEHRF